LKFGHTLKKKKKKKKKNKNKNKNKNKKKKLGDAVVSENAPAANCLVMDSEADLGMFRA